MFEYVKRMSIILVVVTIFVDRSLQIDQINSNHKVDIYCR